jgi:signal transduction histidine kinase
MSGKFSLFDDVRSGSASSVEAGGEDALSEAVDLALAISHDPAWCCDAGGMLLASNAPFDRLDATIRDGLLGLAGERCGSAGEDWFDMAGGGGSMRLGWRPSGNVTIFTANLKAEEAAPVSAAPVRGDAGQELDAAGIGWARYDAETRLVGTNATFREMFGLERSFTDGRPRYFSMLDELRRLRQLPEQADFRAFRNEELALFDERPFPLKDWLYLPDGRVIRRRGLDAGEGGIAFLYEDDTERLRLESDRKSLGAVQQTTLDNLFEGAALFGSDGRLRLANTRFLELCGMRETDPEEHLTGVIERLAPVLDDPGVTEDIRRLLLSGLDGRVPGNLRFALADGRSFDAATVPLPDGAVLLSLLDVTSDVQIQTALQEKAEAFAAADRLKSEFIANVSYEVRTPLTALVGFAEVLKDETFGRLQGRQRDYAEAILRSSRELSSLVGDILDLAVVEAGQVELDISRVDVHALVVATLRRTEGLASRRRVKLSFDVAPDIGWMAVDERRMQQALYNLVCSALARTPTGGRVTMSAWRDDEGDETGAMVLSVSDSGIAPDDAALARMQGNAQAVAGFTGATGDLGMTIVRKFVELHGGRLDIRRGQRHGLIVECRLPA